MTEDRIYKDYDRVENLADLIEAREERDSAFADSVDAMEDLDTSALPEDPMSELVFPHHHGPSEDELLGIDVKLLDTPDERDIGFDWQDSAEEMLPTDPDANEGMGVDDILESFAHVDPSDLPGPVPSTEYSPETDTAATEEEKIKYDLDGGERECPRTPLVPVELDSAMDTESDEFDFTIDDRFAGEVDHTAAEFEFEQLRRAAEEEEVTD